MTRTLRWLAPAVLIAPLLLAVGVDGQQGAANGEWRRTGGDGGRR